MFLKYHVKGTQRGYVCHFGGHCPSVSQLENCSSNIACLSRFLEDTVVNASELTFRALVYNYEVLKIAYSKAQASLLGTGSCRCILHIEHTLQSGSALKQAWWVAYSYFVFPQTCKKFQETSICYRRVSICALVMHSSLAMLDFTSWSRLLKRQRSSEQTADRWLK